MADHEKKDQSKEFSRRSFLKMLGGTAAGVAFGGAIPQLFNLGGGLVAIPASEGYLLVDTMKCAGCSSCMLACSLVHEGKENVSLSRIQITQNPFKRFPYDISLYQCRQCTSPACIEACPTGALAADKNNGNVRTVDERKCIGCMQCVEACPQTPSRVIWNFEDHYSMKCDLCVDTPHWEEKGGPNGKRACESICPVNAIKFVAEIPTQYGNVGYDVNLRGPVWEKLGF
ncbi:MAG: 4Fe-4S binding protein [Limnochordia bacterium]|nr:4Fe-4S binding protein [Limnochordia bacterium]